MAHDKNKPAGSRGVAYIRISSDKQDVESQKESIQRWLDRHDLSVMTWYQDVGARDLAFKRQDFQQLLRAVQAGLIDWIVIDSLDRIGVRDGLDFSRLVCELRDNDCELWSVVKGNLTAPDVGTKILGLVDGEQSRTEQMDKALRSLRGKITGIRKGTWQGGYCPFGFDVACFGPDGQEKWRVYFEGHHRRLQLFPDGRPPKRFDGKGQFPGRDPGDFLRLVPSCDAARVETVRKLFLWYATESISLRALAMRLNDLGIPNPNGQGWYSVLVKGMLTNPVYLTGMTVYNKKAHGRFLEWVNGEYREVQRKKGRAPTGRHRAEADFIYPQGTFQGLIDQGTWDAVQAKLKGVRSPGKAPRHADLWLAGFLYCGHCGCRMSAWHLKSDKTSPRCYTCSTYRKLGKKNPHGCRLHRVRHEVILALVHRYLDETGQKLDTLLGATEETELLAALEEQADRTTLEYVKALGGIWQEVRATGASPPPGQPWSHTSLCHAYREAQVQNRGELARLLAAKQEEMARLVKNLARLTSDAAIEATNQEIEALGREIAELRGRLQPLDQKLQGLRADLERCRQHVEEARKALAGSAERRKAEALGKVIARVVCHFRHDRAGTQDRSILVRAEIEPLVGQTRTVTPDGDFRNGGLRVLN
jgi:site-specific DNA recombinase